MTLLAIIIFLLDRISKALALKLLIPNQPFPVIKNFFYLTLVYNRGAAFGIFKGKIIFFILVTILAAVLIYINLRKHKSKNNYSYNIALVLILAGGLGNLIDRIFYGHVIDFLDFRFWPVFNVADSAITVGAFILGWSLFFRQKNKT